jgi:hypothetical protein
MAPPPTRHLALDGASFRLGGTFDLTEPATSVGDLSLRGRLVEVTAGPRELGEDLAGALGISSFDSELSFHGGTLRTVEAAEHERRAGLTERPMLVVWEGERFSLATRLYGLTLTEVLGLLRPLGFAEHADGITVTAPAIPGYGFTRPASVIKEVPGLGVLEMSRPTREDTAQLPPWDGAAVAAGRLYRDTLSDGGTFFLLSGPGLWATVVPLHGADAEQAGARLPGLELAVEDAAGMPGPR